MLVVAGCKSAGDRKWLGYFFDGVPSGTVPAGPAAPAGDTNEPAPLSVRAVLPKEPETHYHSPFIQNRCAECHASKSGMGLLAPPRDLCFNCHTNFLAGKKVRHTPVESGDCLSCHSPHQSPNKNLLLKPAGEMCLDCHDNPAEKAKFKHQPAQNGDCMACHDAHASNQKKLVLKGTPALCWDCHDNFLEKAKFTHDAVTDCNACHSPHESAEPKLLVKNATKLCFDCHEEKDIKEAKGHENAGTQSCMACHDAHVGQDKYLLKVSRKTPTVTAK